jgi:hypothetical protein
MEVMRGELQFATGTMEQYDVKFKQLEDQLRESNTKVHITSKDKHVPYTLNFLCTNLLFFFFFCCCLAFNLWDNECLRRPRYYYKYFCCYKRGHTQGSLAYLMQTD